MANKKKQNLIGYFLSKNPVLYNGLRNNYFNESVSDYVRKTLEKNKILEYHNHLVQQYDPIYQDTRVGGLIGFRSHFFAPGKRLFGATFDTYWFNMTVVWLYTMLLYISLYYEWFKKILDLPERLKLRKKKQGQ
jgi:hypothetical protein